MRRLQQHTKYEVVVQAVNTHGEGPLSPVTVAQTREAGEAAQAAQLCSFVEIRVGNEPSQIPFGIPCVRVPTQHSLGQMTEAAAHKFLISGRHLPLTRAMSTLLVSPDLTSPCVGFVAV